MNTKLILVVAAVSVLTLSNWQPVNAQSWVIGGNTVTKDTSLGTKNNFALRFITNNSLRMTLTPGGDFGLGTSIPASRFEVRRGSGSNIAKFTNGAVNGDRSALIDVQNGDGVRWRYGVGGTGNSLGLTIGQFYIATSSATAASLAIATNGFVGIGTTFNQNKRLFVVSPGTYTEDSTYGGDALIVRAWGNGPCYAVNTFSNNSYGIWAGTGNSGAYAGYFAGSVFTTGTYQPSDRKFKQNIVDLTSAMSVINKLQPKEYEYRHDGNLQLMNLPQGKQYGLIAQDVEQVLPGMVKETKFNTENMSSAEKTAAAKGEEISFKALNYTELIPVMIKAIQELSTQNADLQKQVDELKGAKTARGQSAASQHSVTNLILSSASLDNYPNPFTRTTTIHYNLPAGFRTAQIVITDNSGTNIKKVQLNTAGNGTVKIDASTFASGTYNYSLVTDGKVIENKKMIVAH